MWPGTLRFVLHDGVQAALHAGRAVVALESTIITHGLPRPLNYEMAVAAEDQIRRVGAEPATIAAAIAVAIAVAVAAEAAAASPQ